MKNCWTLLLLAAILQSLTLSVLAGGNHGHGGSNLAHILAAGLIVQLLARGGGQGGEGRHAMGRHAGGGGIHSEYSPYGHSWEESRMAPESTLASSSWAQRAPMDIAYSQAQYKEPLMESFNIPYYYQQHQPHALSQGMW